MAKHITKIDDIEDEVGRAIARLSLQKFYNGDEASLVAGFNLFQDQLDELDKNAQSPFKQPSELILRFPTQ